MKAPSPEASKAPSPNPQGKGLAPVLQGLNQHRPDRWAAPKQVAQVEMELFTSLFVLQSDFKFNPVPGRTYWLYRYPKGYRLLLVGPDEWRRPCRGRFIGECILQRDRTWTLSLAPSASQDQEFMAVVERRRRELQKSLERADSLEAALPGWQPGLCYHGQALLFALGKSLAFSMALSGIGQLSWRKAKGLLPKDFPTG